MTDAWARAAAVKLSSAMPEDPWALAKFQQAQGELSSSLSRLLVVVERYPDLKASQNFLDLQNPMEGTENRINVARSTRNRYVEPFNTSIRVFPNNLTNRYLLNLKLKEPFTAE